MTTLIRRCWEAILCKPVTCAFCKNVPDDCAQYVVRVGFNQEQVTICSACWAQVCRGLAVKAGEWRVGDGYMVSMSYGLDWFTGDALAALAEQVELENAFPVCPQSEIEGMRYRGNSREG